jgi:hypothetical protein
MQIDGEAWVVKFSEGEPVDAPLVEHATMTLVRRVCAVVRGWQAHFAAHGVRPRDVESLAQQIDRPHLRDHREGF